MNDHPSADVPGRRNLPARRQRLAVVLAGATLLAAGLLSTGASQPAPATVDDALAEPTGKPNIVLILTDDMRADELRLMPNVRRLLVRNGTSYRHALSPHPVCCPARAEIITGQFGQNNGVQENYGPWGGYQALSQPSNTVAAWLQNTGYRTSYHGKFLNGYPAVSSPDEPGWTRWDAQVGGIYSYDRMAAFVDGDRIEDDYITHIIRRRTDRTLATFARSGAPFFTIINHVAPHGSPKKRNPPVSERKHRDAFRTLLPPSYGEPSFQERNISDLPADLRPAAVSTRLLVRLTRQRARALQSVDEAVAATIARLRRLGELANTYVVFTSDNGFQLGEHRLLGKNLPFDESFDIPLVVRGPDIAPGVVVEEPVTLVDLAATFLDWAGGVPAGRPLDGLPLDRIGNSHPRDTLLVQIGDSADDTDGWRYRGVTTGRYLFAIHAGNPNQGVLFDRAVDPHATVNRFADPAYGEVRLELLRRTQELQSCAGQAECNQSFGAVPKPG